MSGYNCTRLNVCLQLLHLSLIVTADLYATTILQGKYANVLGTSGKKSPTMTVEMMAVFGQLLTICTVLHPRPPSQKTMDTTMFRQSHMITILPRKRNCTP